MLCYVYAAFIEGRIIFTTIHDDSKANIIFHDIWATLCEAIDLLIETSVCLFVNCERFMFFCCVKIGEREPFWTVWLVYRRVGIC